MATHFSIFAWTEDTIHGITNDQTLLKWLSTWAEHVCPSPKFMCWKLTPHVMVLGDEACWRWLGQEGGALVVGLVPLLTWPQSTPLPLLSHEDSAGRWSFATRRRASSEPSHTSTWPQAPSLKPWERDVCCLWYTQPVVLCYSSLNGLKYLKTKKSI